MRDGNTGQGFLRLGDREGWIAPMRDGNAGQGFLRLGDREGWIAPMRDGNRNSATPSAIATKVGLHL